MRYLLALSMLSFGVMAGTGTNTATTNYVENTNAPTFVTPLSIGGGDVLPTHDTVTINSATCSSNQLIFETAHTKSALSGHGAPKIGNYGLAVGAKIVIPFGDKGACLKRAKLINRSAELEYVRNTHNLCMGSAQSFKAANMFLKDDYYEAYPDMRVCRAIFVMAGVSYAQP